MLLRGSESRDDRGPADDHDDDHDDEDDDDSKGGSRITSTEGADGTTVRSLSSIRPLKSTLSEVLGNPPFEGAEEPTLERREV